MRISTGCMFSLLPTLTSSWKRESTKSRKYSTEKRTSNLSRPASAHSCSCRESSPRTIAITAMRRDTEPGPAPTTQPTLATSSSAASAVRSATPLQTVRRKPNTSRSSNKSNRICYWNHSTASSKRNSTRKTRKRSQPVRLLLLTSTKRNYCPFKHRKSSPLQNCPV